MQRGPLAVVLALAVLRGASGCGAADVDAPYTPPPPPCREADDYLRPLFQLQDEGKLERLARALREQVPEDARRDLIDALLRLLGAFEEGSFSALASLPKPAPDPAQPARPGLQRTLAALVRWLAETGPGAPNLPLMGVMRRTIATCEGRPVFELLEEVVADDALLAALGDLLGSPTLADALAGLDFEGQSGRAALQYLVRNLLVSASSPAFDVARIVDLLDLIIDVDQPPYDALADGLVRLLDADGLPRLQGLLVCLGDVDRDLVLGGFLYDLVTSGLLMDVMGVLEPPADGSGELIPPALLEIVTAALHFFVVDDEARRELVPGLLALLGDDVAPGALGDVANLLEAEALTGIVELLTDIASRACHP